MSSVQAPPGSPNRRQNPRAGPAVLGERLSHGWRLARRIFHVLIGLTFFFFAAAGATLSYAEWQTYSRTPSSGVWRFAMLAAFTLLLVIFGVHSFVKTRSVR